VTDSSGRLSFAKQRQELLLELLRAHGSISVSKVAPELQVSELTIRRDVNALAARGLVTRVHGGAVLVGDSGPDAPTTDGDGQPRRTRFTFGLVTPALDYYWPWVIAGVRAGCATARARLILRGASYDITDLQKQIRSLVDRSGVDGLLVPPTMDLPESRAFLHWLDDLPVPVVLVDRRPP
jgi:ABC-type sugar transport system substrate-binding protein